MRSPRLSQERWHWTNFFLILKSVVFTHHWCAETAGWLPNSHASFLSFHQGLIMWPRFGTAVTRHSWQFQEDLLEGPESIMVDASYPSPLLSSWSLDMKRWCSHHLGPWDDLEDKSWSLGWESQNSNGRPSAWGPEVAMPTLACLSLEFFK